jgi:hypothetical protein
VLRYLFRHGAQPPYLRDGAYRCARPLDDRFTAQDLLIPYDVEVSCGLHTGVPLLLLSASYELPHSLDVDRKR